MKQFYFSSAWGYGQSVKDSIDLLLGLWKDLSELNLKQRWSFEGGGFWWIYVEIITLALSDQYMVTWLYVHTYENILGCPIQYYQRDINFRSYRIVLPL